VPHSGNQAPLSKNTRIPVSFADTKEATTLIETLTIKDAEASDALGNIVRLGNSGVRWLIVTPGKRNSRKAIDELDKLGDSLFAHRHRGGLEAVNNYFLRQIAIAGVVSGEIIVKPNRTGVQDIFPVDVRDLNFDNEPEYGFPIYVHDKSGKTYLNPITYNYIPLATPLSGVPYPIPPLYSAIEETQGLYNMIESIKDGALKQRLLGLLTVKLKRVAQLQNQSDDDWRKEQASILGSVSNEFSKALKEGLLVHFDDSEPKFLSFAGELSKWAQVLPAFERRTSRSLNFAWIREHGTVAAAYMSIQLEKMLSEIQSLQALLANLLARTASLHLSFVGVPVIKSIVDLDKHSLRIWDKINTQADAFKKLIDMGVTDRFTVADELGYTPPEEFAGDPESQGEDEKLAMALTAALYGTKDYIKLYDDNICLTEVMIQNGRVKVRRELEYTERDLIELFYL